MDFKHINLEISGPVGWYRFNRSPRNSIHWEMMYELRQAFEALLQRQDVKVIVIASNNAEFFSTGGTWWLSRT